MSFADIMWMCQNVGLAAGNLLMAIAIITANWQKLADQAVAYAAEEEVRGLLSGVTHYHHSHSPASSCGAGMIGLSLCHSHGSPADEPLDVWI